MSIMSELPDILHATGIKVSEVPGWRTRGHGQMGDVVGTMIHHTVGGPKGNMPSLHTITAGRGGSHPLSGPLANIGVGRDGTHYIVAAGSAYHAGPGMWQGVSAGNTRFIGYECENNGTTEVWPEVQLDAMRHSCAAILKRLGQNAIMCPGHKEYALPKGRKIDPDFDMPAFRRDIAAIMGGTAPHIEVTPVEDEKKRPTLMRGSRGEFVIIVQRTIGIDADGIFGVRTEARVRDYQRGKGLVPDGRVGPRTWAVIDVG